MPKNYYQLLGVDRSAGPDEIKRAFRRAAMLYHPDRRPDDPDATAKFRELARGYQVLMDPTERARYDRKLPEPAYPLEIYDQTILWKEATRLLFSRSDRFTPTLKAMQTSVPVYLEEDLLVVGLAPADYQMASYLQTPAEQHDILMALQEVTGKPIELNVIEGTTLADWESVKRGRARTAQPTRAETAAPAREAKAKAEPAAEPEPAAEIWEQLHQRLHRNWQQAHRRSFPQNRARFLLEAIPLLIEAEGEALLYGASDEAIDRAVGKAIERLAGMTELPATIVALEVARHRSG